LTGCLQINGNQYYDEYIFIAPGSDYGRAMWRDIEQLPNGKILDNAIKKTGKLISVLHHIHFSFAINRRVQLPFQSIWKRFYALESVQLDDKKSYCVIYTDISAARTDCTYLKRLSEKENVTMILVMVNTMARRGSLIEKRRPYFEQTYSFDKQDCEKYGFLYHPTNYSMIVDTEEQPTENDAFYVGVSKGRAEIITQVYEKLSSNGAAADFFISGIEKGARKLTGIHYNQWLSYAQVLEHIRHSDCIVEIMDGAQEGVTLRTMEAICYNKKLLTNNQSMKQSKYYESGNIQVFEKPEEIDVDFVKEKTKVDYGYDGEFSPIHLLEHINRTTELSRKKK